ncbi:MAG: CDP-glucose 4,6-dehydratase [Lachnospiraceae bacterium]|nr:CDP-glucose 4,6-dehydratase [Lachnospiraceae bacterium]
MKTDYSFYKGKRVLITGHTGFKGSWMSKLLLMQGAEVTGYALEPPAEPALFDILQLDKDMDSVTGDVRDLASLKECFDRVKPEIVIHMAAQPIVRESYKNPVYTYETNVMGTVNLLECIRLSDDVRSVVNVTTDKVYLNREWEWGYRENEQLDGYDPYSNSKSCSELVTGSYIRSFLKDKGIAVSTMRAGNVIGGGDYAADRIIPDCVRAACKGESIIVRNPYSVRPYQHVLEPVNAYLMVAMKQYEDAAYAGNYNVGPDEDGAVSTGNLVDEFTKLWTERSGRELKWINKNEGGPHEAGYLRLDCSKLKATFGWKPKWDINNAVGKSVEWYYAFDEGADVIKLTEKQISEYIDMGTE